MTIVHNCSRQVQLVSYIETVRPTANSGWWLDYFFRDIRTRDERLEFRKWSRGKVLPLLYTGACLPPNLIDRATESLTQKEISFPTIKAEGKITGCDVDEERINKEDGSLVPVGIQRFDKAFNETMSQIVEGLRATHIHEAITLLKTGGYVLHSDRDDEDIGTIDFNRADELRDIDLTGTPEGWDSMCSKPLKTIEAIVREMGKHGAIANGVDVVYSPLAWEAMEAHEERQAIKASRDSIFGGFDASMFFNYADVQFMGATNGGQIRHWVNYTLYLDHQGNEVPALAPGEILIVSKDGFDGQRIFRTVTSDNREELPDGSLPFFLYDGIEEYKRKCRSFEPWIEEYHLNVPRNVNGAALVRVVPEDFESCVPCETCE